MADMIKISEASAAGLSLIGLGEFYVWETPERMAYVVMVLKQLDDVREWLPRGKWALIQDIERQLESSAYAEAETLMARLPDRQK